MLQDLDAAQIDAFLNCWHENSFDDAAQAAPKHERLKKAIRDSKSIAMLAGNPLLLTMMAILNRNQELPRDRVDQYAQATRLLLHQWDTERALAEFPGLSTDIGWREKHDLLRRVASFMQSGPSGLKGNMIDGPTLTSLVEAYLRTELNFPQSRAAARAVVEHLRQRNFILCFVGADSYGFVHRTFLEYFCATDFVHQFNITKMLDEPSLLALFDKHFRDDDWREVLRLIGSQIDGQFVGQIVEHLALRTNPADWDYETPLAEFPLAMYCLSEVRNASRLAPPVLILFERILTAYEKAAGAAVFEFFDQRPLASRAISDMWPNLYSDIDRLVAISRSYDTDTGRIFSIGAGFPAFVANALGSRIAVESMIGKTNPNMPVLQALVETWPDETMRELLRDRAVEDQHAYVRRDALESLAANWPDVLSKFHKTVITRDLDGLQPYLDPQPILWEHIEKAATKAGIAAVDLDAQIASLNQHLGWDITVGAGPAAKAAPK